MRSVYVIGGAGTGKSTFTQAVLTELGAGLLPLEDLLTLPNKKNDVTLRAHRLTDGGMYLGVMRDSFPGTDGLDRASSPVGEAWLRAGEGLPRYLLGEGATLATTRFLTALQECSNLLLVHLECDPVEVERRFGERGSNQNPNFVKTTVTRSRNRAAEIASLGGRVLRVNSEDGWSWEVALDLAVDHLRRS